MASPVASGQSTVPLCVDLDGTVIKSDMLWESLVRLLRQNPLYLVLVFLWWTRGRAYLKQQIARRVEVDVTRVPLCTGFVDFLRREFAGHRPIYLVTASDRALAERLAAHLNLFTGVLASDGKTNLRGRAKAASLAARFGKAGFDYAGNSSVDYPVWEAAREAIVVNASSDVEHRAKQRTKVTGVFEPLPSPWPGLLRTIRPHQWVKNLILFVPLLTAHKLSEPAILLKAALGFIGFCFAASAVYVINDLADLDADRDHAAKRARPFASGDLSLHYGFILIPVLLGLAAAVLLTLPLGFAVVLACYFLLTSLYSWRLKQLALIDVFCLAGLYTLRLIAGHEATGVAYSAWLLVFSMFIFLSLALVKRFVELKSARVRNTDQIKGRGYAAGDLEIVTTLGVTSGFLAVLVLALYVNSKEVLELYRHPILLLLICPLLLYWISRVWLLAHRGLMHEDPILFALKDVASYAIGVLSLLVVWIAAGS